MVESRKSTGRIVVADVGGSSIKLMATDWRDSRTVSAGLATTPVDLVESISEMAGDARPSAVSIGYPGEVRNGVPTLEPNHLGSGWVGFDYETALRCPVQIVNDAAMQAWGAYRGGRMLFLGLGTGLGSALVAHRTLVDLELSQLPFRDGLSYGDALRQRGLDRFGVETWCRNLFQIVELLGAAFVADELVIGGGNARLVKAPFPPRVRFGQNDDAFRGGFRLWDDAECQEPRE